LPQASATPGARRDYRVQRWVDSGPLASSGAATEPGAALLPQAAYVDAGEIAVSRGLARRDNDGSVVFSFSPSADAPSADTPAPSSHRLARSDASGVWTNVASSPETVQREALESSGGAAEASPETTSPTAVPVSSATPGPSPAPGSLSAGAPAAAVPGVPLDELARQLFGPLSARLKAELRLERERVGLLTDLLQ
jgi:hypothetical protein